MLLFKVLFLLALTFTTYFSAPPSYPLLSDCIPYLWCGARATVGACKGLYKYECKILGYTDVDNRFLKGDGTCVECVWKRERKVTCIFGSVRVCM